MCVPAACRRSFDRFAMRRHTRAFASTRLYYSASMYTIYTRKYSRVCPMQCRAGWTAAASRLHQLNRRWTLTMYRARPRFVTIRGFDHGPLLLLAQNGKSEHESERGCRTFPANDRDSGVTKLLFSFSAFSFEQRQDSRPQTALI